MALAPRHRLLLLLVSLCLASVAPTDTRAEGPVWIGVRAGVGIGSSLSFDVGTDLFTSASPPEASLGIHLWLQSALADFGVSIENSSAGGTPAVGMNERLFAQLRGMAHLRWKFVNAGSTAVFLTIGAGVAQTRFSDFVRFELARADSITLDRVERSPVGLVVASEAGFYFGLGPAGRLVFSLAFNVSNDEVRVGDRARQFSGFLGQFHLGIEWSL